ncbi:DUF502 domain-containing protein [Marinomonas ostreistagni]|uniref:DUF502 domain-containing protein n=1 Tax=Marinomonas ostreistagni TaxID=359209 RepID=UPI001951BDD2|nr:DUF502 domain-containing protein [Marinomonas ostreistagni]MBM6550924.1 DUF502 domain-containing protein [Marinomonas ostreistagni]
MNKLISMILKGLVAVLPIGLTIYFFYWLLATAEELARPLVLLVWPSDYYFPGLGVVTSLLLLALVGLVVNFYGIRYLMKLSQRLFEKIPLVKSIYGALQDMMTVFNLSKKTGHQSVVSLEIQGMQMIGFVTGEQMGKRLFGEQDLVGVYLPLSYQIGGMTVYVSRDKLTPLDVTMEEGMRIAVTGGVQSKK